MTESKSKKKVLVLAVNPKGTVNLRLDEEVREIREARQRSTNREGLDIFVEMAVRTKDLQQKMLEHRPHIVHFCGHGAGQQGLIFEDIQGKAKPVSTEALASLFGLLGRYIECVVLNACYSDTQAKEISNYIKYVVGMRQDLGDRAAIEYSRDFYTALAAGESYDLAHEFGRNAIQIEGLGEEMTPILKKK
ncbi:MAG: CHAT domain-containing protein [Microcoleaceae cyanobacterium]